MTEAETLWQQRGWHRSSHGANIKEYRGDYLVAKPSSTYQGTIVEELEPSRLRVFILNPPSSLKKHPKGSCFSPVHGDWFGVHFEKEPDNVDSAIVFIENVLQWCTENA